MWQQLLPALALMLVFEGIMPFLSPKNWRQTMQQATRLTDAQLRKFGLISMIIGVGLLYIT